MAKLFKFVKWGAPTILFIRFNFFKNLFDFSKLDNSFLRSSYSASEIIGLSRLKYKLLCFLSSLTFF